MTYTANISRAICAVAALACLSMTGCQTYQHGRAYYQPPPPSPPLGTVTDAIWKAQEARAEASDFVIYLHEFNLDSEEINHCGQDHLKQIALRLQHNPRVPVIVERSLHSAHPHDEFEFEVHPNPELDNRRREMVVRYLSALGVPDADRRVVVTPALAPPYSATEAQQALQGFQGQGLFGFGRGGFGGLGAGLGGIGGIGGFGF